MASKYLSYLPKPVLDQLVAGRWLPIIGAGMSLNAVLSGATKMPLWPDLSKLLAGELVDFVPSSVVDAISAYVHEFGRARLVERLTELLHVRDAQPGRAHRAFCSIPFDIVCTTNFDFLLERQYDLLPQYVYPVVDEEQLSIKFSGAGTLLLKLHGDLRHPSRLIATEADFDGFLSNYPLLATYLANQLITKTAVLVGYSLDDPDFRQVWHTVTERLGQTRHPSYALTVGARPSDVARFERRGVKTINLPGTSQKYGDVLADAFDELAEYMRDNVISVSKVKEERPLRELILPRDATTRLCFFSLPLDLLSFYRDRVFPVVEEIGFVPITADDVITPGDTVSAKIDALIDRASIVVIEWGSQWTNAEYLMAVARRKGSSERRSSRQPLHLIVVITDGEQLPPPVTGYETVVRQSLLSDESDAFVEELRARLSALAGTIGINEFDEPRKLLAVQQYRAAVVSAMTLLESALRDQMRKKAWTDVQRPMSMRSLIDRAIEDGIILPKPRKQLREWMHVRNQVAHTPQQISRAKAHAIVEGVLDVLRSMKHPEPQ